MLKCPACRNVIPFYRAWIVTNYNHITCSTCGKKIYANKKISSIIGGIGGGSGALISFNLILSHFNVIMISLIILWLLCMLLAAIIFTRFELKE